MLDRVFFAVVLIKYLGTNNNSRDHSNLIKRFSYRALKGMWSMLWWIEAAGRNQEDVVLFSCQIINTGQTGRGWSSWTARHIICQSLLCTSETLLKLLHCTCKCSLTAAVDFFPLLCKSSTALVDELPPLYRLWRAFWSWWEREMWSTLSLNKRLLFKIQRS